MNQPPPSSHQSEQRSSASSRQPPQESMTRQVPIPPPNHPRQYRAIGLIKGKYQRSLEKMNRGVLVTSDGTLIDAVILGKVISVLKNHVDLEKPHLWVVYPRNRQINDQLHLQIAGIWEPETLAQNLPSLTEPKHHQEPLSPLIENGYFSIRGEAIFASSERKTVIIKIRQSPKTPSQKAKFFKVKLKGILPDNAVGHFWELDVKLEKDILIIQTATDLGLIPKKKPILNYNKQKSKEPFKPRTQRPLSESDRPFSPRKLSDIQKPFPIKKPLPKPIKNNRPDS